MSLKIQLTSGKILQVECNAILILVCLLNGRKLVMVVHMFIQVYLHKVWKICLKLFSYIFFVNCFESVIDGIYFSLVLLIEGNCPQTCRQTFPFVSPLIKYNLCGVKINRSKFLLCMELRI